MARTVVGRRAEAAAVRERVRFEGLPLERLALLAVGAVALALRLWPLDHFSVDFQDEGVYWQSLKAMAAGQPLFSVVFSSQPPFFLAGLLPFYLLFGQTLVAARLGVAFYSLLGLAAVYYIGRATAGRWAGVLACALLAVDPLYLAESHTVQAEMPSEALALAGVALAAVAVGRTGPPRRWRAAASGVALGLGVMTKLFDLGALVPAVLYLAAPLVATRASAQEPSRQRDASAAWRTVAPDLLLLALGFSAACALTLAPFLSVRGLVYDQVVRFHQVAEQGSALGKHDWRDNVTLIRDTVSYYVSAPYLLLALAGVILALWRRAWAIVPPLAWLVVSLGLLVHQQPLIWHHVVLLSPLLAILGGAAPPLARGPHPRPLRIGLSAPRSRQPTRLSRARERGAYVPAQKSSLLPGGRIGPNAGSAEPGDQSAWVGGEGLLTYAVLALAVISALFGLRQSVEANRSPVVSFAPAVPSPSAAVQLRMADALRVHTRPGEVVVTDGQYIAGLAGHAVLPQTVDTSWVRIKAGPRYFSTHALEDLIVRDNVRTVLFATGRLAVDAAFHRWVEQRYRKVASFGGDRALYQK